MYLFLDRSTRVLAVTFTSHIEIQRGDRMALSSYVLDSGLRDHVLKMAIINYRYIYPGYKMENYLKLS